MPTATISKRKATNQFYEEELDPKTHLRMMQIPAGTFLMGSPDRELERMDRESPQHRVSVPSFFMAKYPVTQAQWRVVADMPQVNTQLKPDPSKFKGDNRPVEQVSWEEAIEFCDRLTAYTNRQYRLPSEAEWEYACRAGTTTPFHFGETISPELANYRSSVAYADGAIGKQQDETTSVDYFEIANAWGLCDMHGNVLEWCQDRFHNNYEGAPEDGSAWLQDFSANPTRMIRGGSWGSYPRSCRSAYRINDNPDGRSDLLGFRVSCSAPATL
jgi:formylglycine-generating enzyme required for sulfatase activity